MTSSLSCHLPLELSSLVIVFCWCLLEAFSWKKDVFLSPDFSQKFLDHCFHISSFAISILLSSTFVACISSMFVPHPSKLSSHWNFLLSDAIFQPTWPKVVLFQLCKKVLHSSMHLPNWFRSPKFRPLSWASFTTPSHSLSLIHIASNLNNRYLLLFLLLGGEALRISMLWSDEQVATLYSLTHGNKEVQFVETKAQSNLLRTHPRAPNRLLHVNSSLTQPMSLSLLLLIADKNALIFHSDLSPPPSFSPLCLISLKSPMQTHGRSLLVLKFTTNLHDSSLLLVSKWP